MYFQSEKLAKSSRSAMSLEAVLISSLPEGNASFYSSRSSGILFNHRYVITTGTIFATFLQDPNLRLWICSTLKTMPSYSETNEKFSRTLFKIYRDILNENSDCNFSPVQQKKLYSTECRVLRIWQSSLVMDSLTKLFYDWTVKYTSSDDSSNESIDEIDVSKELISVFVLLECKSSQNENQSVEELGFDHITAMTNLLNSLENPIRGQEVEVLSTPFGNELFFNSLSRGIIGNIVGKGNCIILTDARTITGCEGGPIFITLSQSNKKSKRRGLIGLVTCPLTWCRGEWVGLTIGISLMPVLNEFLQGKYKAPELSEAFFKIPVQSALESIDEFMVLVRCGRSWGSGVVLDSSSGTIITCSHVLNCEESVSVFKKGKHYSAKIIYKTPGTFAYDLAIIRVEEVVFKKKVEFCNEVSKLGDPVIAIGFPFFSEEDDFDLRPSLVYGCVSHLNPYMIQTTCCIQSGFSGGALLKDGKLLGVIVSNSRDSCSGALFPHINFVVPSSTFKELFFNFLKTNDIRFLENLKSSNPEVQSLWSSQCSKL